MIGRRCWLEALPRIVPSAATTLILQHVVLVLEATPAVRFSRPFKGLGQGGTNSRIVGFQ
jgi:hypothetical protein